MPHAKLISNKLKKISKEIKYIFFLFVITRIYLTITGVFSRKVLFASYPYHPDWVFSKHIWLDIFGIWDSGWYLNIARNWYKVPIGNEWLGKTNYGFFPLYPLLIKIAGFFTRDYYIAGLIISNFFLIVACIYIYKLVKLDSDEKIARRSIKYLFLFPTAFILSGVFSESLLLALIIASFYYSKKQKWHLAGIAGYFAALTKPVGVFIFLPLLYEYYKTEGFKIKNTKLDFLYLLLIPLGTLTFAFYTYLLTGDFLAYVHVKQVGWGNKLSNPLVILYGALKSSYLPANYNAWFVVAVILILILGYRKIGFSYFLLGMLFIFVPLLEGGYAIFSMMRYSLSIFPLFIIAAKSTSNKKIDVLLTIFLIILQGILMVLWVPGFDYII